MELPLCGRKKASIYIFFSSVLLAERRVKRMRGKKSSFCVFFFLSARHMLDDILLRVRKLFSRGEEVLAATGVPPVSLPHIPALPDERTSWLSHVLPRFGCVLSMLAFCLFERNQGLSFAVLLACLPPVYGGASHSTSRCLLPLKIPSRSSQVIEIASDLVDLSTSCRPSVLFPVPCRVLVAFWS